MELFIDEKKKILNLKEIFALYLRYKKLDGIVHLEYKGLTNMAKMKVVKTNNTKIEYIVKVIDYVLNTIPNDYITFIQKAYLEQNGSTWYHGYYSRATAFRYRRFVNHYVFNSLFNRPYLKENLFKN